MKPSMILAAAVTVCLSAAALQAPAAEEPAASRPAPPELKFEMSQTPYPGERLGGPRDNRFVLIVRVRMPEAALHALTRGLPGMVDLTPKQDLPSEKIRELLREGTGIGYIRVLQMGGRPGYQSPSYGPSPRESTRYRPRPAGHGPAPAAPAQVRSAGRIGVGPGRPASPAAGREVICEFALVAPTVQQLKELMQALLTVYEVAWARSEQRALRDRLEADRKELAELQPQLDEANRGRQALKEKVEALPDIPAKTVDDLKTKGWLLEVELAGVRARLEAARELIKNVPEEHPRDQIELMRAAAQVDLAGLLGQRERVRKLLEEAAARHAAQRKVDEHNSRFSGIRFREKHLKDSIRSNEATLAAGAFNPLEVIGNRATIRPIDWPKTPVLPPRDSFAPGSGTIRPGGYSPR